MNQKHWFIRNLENPNPEIDNILMSRYHFFSNLMLVVNATSNRLFRHEEMARKRNYPNMKADIELGHW